MPREQLQIPGLVAITPNHCDSGHASRTHSMSYLRAGTCWLMPCRADSFHDSFSRRHKAIVFFPTARLTQYMAELANAAGIPALEIHSKSQVWRPQ